MDSQVLGTVLPTAISASLYAVLCTTFLWTVRRRREEGVHDGAAPRSHGRARGRAPEAGLRAWPTVSILKPIAGLDEELRANLESFATLDYPAYEILFGVADLGDRAVPVIEAFLAAHPDLPARLLRTTPPRGTVHNPKVAQLLDLTAQARGTVLVVSDANVCVSSGYLRAVVGCLLRPGVGLVSSLIAGTGERTFGAALENAQLGAAVAPAVVMSHCLGWPIPVGKSMAMRRTDLERAGGWESVADVLAEDYALGRRFLALGHRVALCLHPVHNRNVRASARLTVERHARWAKMRRGILRTPIFAFEPVLWPSAVAALVWLASPSALSAKLVGCALALQCIGALLCHTLLQVRHPFLLAALEPARAAAASAAWLLALASRRVCWRGNVFMIGEGTKLSPVATAAPETEILRS